ncbi:MAG TPA: hypothetical protein VNM68_08950 [Candidatus Polarisedimenticolia bacterium]|nr:hypothetical protein [Candidatus Polarisedimenticolia bacterium]
MAGVLKALSVGLLIGLVGFAVLQIVPTYFKSYEFENAARNEAHLATVDLRSSDAIRNDIYQKARDLGLPVELGNIKVQSEAHEFSPNSLDTVMDPSATPRTVGRVEIDVSYAVPVEFPGWTFHLNFQFHADDHHM